MWGRAGRRGRGLAVYVAGEDALDQFFCRHPDEFLDRAVEAAILDHESEQIHLQHLLCAAHEAPLSDLDAPALGPRWRLHAQALESAGALRERRGTFVLREPEDYPAARVSLRSASPDSFAVVDVSSGEVLGTVEAARAFSTVHQGAVYLHLGRSTRSPSSTSTRAARWSSRSPATGTRSPRRRPTRGSRSCSTSASPAG
jgi:DEAD/DEAH box helicase domain-containing protein